jgi:hypothetical protein
VGNSTSILSADKLVHVDGVDEVPGMVAEYHLRHDLRGSVRWMVVVPEKVVAAIRAQGSRHGAPVGAKLPSAAARSVQHGEVCHK